MRKFVSVTTLFEDTIQKWFSPSKHSQCILTEAFWWDIPLMSAQTHDHTHIYTDTRTRRPYHLGSGIFWMSPRWLPPQPPHGWSPLPPAEQSYGPVCDSDRDECSAPFNAYAEVPHTCTWHSSDIYHSTWARSLPAAIFRDKLFKLTQEPSQCNFTFPLANKYNLTKKLAKFLNKQMF